MTFKITDPNLINALKSNQGGVELTDADGHFLGMVVTDNLMRPPEGFKSKFTDEELDRRRREESPEYTLAEILKDLEARA